MFNLKLGETYVVKERAKWLHGFDACTHFDDIFEFDVTPDSPEYVKVELLGSVRGGDIYSAKFLPIKLEIVRSYQ